jgi:hypothetical protein
MSRVAAAIVLGLLALGPGSAVRAEEDDGEADTREYYVPLPEFRAYHERERLVVEPLTLIRVRRPDSSEALVAKEAAGWEHVVLDGWRLAFYNLGRTPLRRVTGRHVIVQEWSGGAHCCFDYHVLHLQGTEVRREGTIRAGDCTLRVADIDQDGDLELISCDSRFAYAFDLPFADSPLVPLVYAFGERSYQAESRRYPQVYRFRIAQERRRLAEAEQARDGRAARRAVISLLLHRLYAGQVTEGWCAFEKAYRWPDRTAVKQEVLARLRRSPDPEDGRLPFVDVGYTLAPPGRCP